MKQSNFKRFLSIACFLILLQNSSESVEFTVEKLDINPSPCSSSSGQYTFSIDGTFSGSTSYFTESFTLDLDTSSNNKINAECRPIQTLGVYEFSCIIDISKYPLNNVDILLPTKAPQVSQYTFKNWEQVIGAQPGVSNKIASVSCLPEAEDTFTPSSIEIGDCTIDNKRKFNILGTWEINKYSLYKHRNFDLVLDNSSKDIATCRFPDETKCECEFEGEGVFKIKEQYVTINLHSYKIKEFNSGKTIDDCDDDDFIESILSSDNLQFFNKYLILIGLLLF
jgi:hypothetical protein